MDPRKHVARHPLEDVGSDRNKDADADANTDTNPHALAASSILHKIRKIMIFTGEVKWRNSLLYFLFIFLFFFWL